MKALFDNFLVQEIWVEPIQVLYKYVRCEIILFETMYLPIA